MAWAGKAFFTGVGLVLGGPVGAAIGALIGFAVDSEEDTKSAAAAAAAEEQRKQQVLFYALFSMAGKMAKADGRVSQEEIDLMRHVMNEELKLDEENRKRAIEIFTAAKNSATPFEDYAKQFRAEFSDPQLLQLMLNLLFSISAADGVLHAKEDKTLQAAAYLFGFSGEEYRRIKVQFFGDLDRWYAFLECTPEDSNEHIKAQYKRLAKEYHPDTLSAHHVPETIMLLAKEKFQQINEAYEQIKKQRGL